MTTTPATKASTSTSRGVGGTRHSPSILITMRRSSSSKQRHINKNKQQTNQIANKNKNNNNNNLQNPHRTKTKTTTTKTNLQNPHRTPQNPTTIPPLFHHQALVDAEKEIDRLIALWCDWLRCECAQVPPVFRFDAFVRRRKGGGKCDVFSGELTELGGTIFFCDVSSSFFFIFSGSGFD